MAVYVDEAKHAYGRMLMCHMMADSTDELLTMADKIGVARKWLQKSGTAYEHFDIAKTKRADAVALGAVEVTSRYLGRMILQRKKTATRAALESKP
jgi:pyruvoyl-dependent arginine decarboxylase (PvlArgDC)